MAKDNKIQIRCKTNCTLVVSTQGRGDILHLVPGDLVTLSFDTDISKYELTSRSVMVNIK